MATYNNPKLVPAVTPLESGGLYIDRQITDLANADFITAAVAAGDLIQIGVIGANAVMVPGIASISFPTLDATATMKVGTLADDDAVLASETVTAAEVKDGDDLVLTGTVGSADEPTPIYLEVGGTVGGFATTGKIVFDVAQRAYRSDVDG
ncbi:MAG: hypothetical protein L0H83_11465 [Salinisphaera sp.]|nr:hypothetical protein [Salinisphaera sp.]